MRSTMLVQHEVVAPAVRGCRGLLAAVGALLWSLSGCAEVCAVDDDDTWIEAAGTIAHGPDALPIQLTYHVVDDPPGFVATIGNGTCQPVDAGDTCETTHSSSLTSSVSARHGLDPVAAQDYDSPVTVLVEATDVHGAVLLRSEQDVALDGSPGSETCPRSRTGSFTF